jgi:hypothetical protein
MKDLLDKAEFLVDADGKKKAVVVDLEVWDELQTLIEDLEDAAEIQSLRDAGEETIDRQAAKNELGAKEEAYR